MLFVLRAPDGARISRIRALSLRAAWKIAREDYGCLEGCTITRC